MKKKKQIDSVANTVGKDPALILKANLSSMETEKVVEQACSVTNLLIGENLVGVSKDMDLTCHRSTLTTLSSQVFNWIEKVKPPIITSTMQDPVGCVRWHCPLQFPCHDPPLDVPNGSHLWQHLYNEGMR